MMLKSTTTLIATLAVATGCASTRMAACCDEVEVVQAYLLDSVGPQGDSRMVSAHVGRYHGGTAILSETGLAFWVNDGIGYSVNDAAREIAPELNDAPAHVQFDNEFLAAVEVK